MQISPNSVRGNCMDFPILMLENGISEFGDWSGVFPLFGCFRISGLGSSGLEIGSGIPRVSFGFHKVLKPSRYWTGVCVCVDAGNNGPSLK